MAGFALVAGLSSGISFLNYRADSFVVEHFEGTAGVAIYANAVLIAESVWQFSGSLALATVARIGGLPRQEAIELTTRVMRHTLVILLAVCGFLFVSADVIVGLFFDKEFSGMATALRILLPGVMLYGLAPAYSSFYTYQAGRPSASALVAAAGLIVDIGLDFILVPWLGVNGAALASAIAYASAILGAIAVFLWTTKTPPSRVLRFGRADIDDYRQLISRLRQLALRRGRGIPA
jgi:O-antigen/teichoic acid export membrane protein